MLDPQTQQIMSLVDQVEALPPEVLDIVMHRKQQMEKDNKKGQNDQKDEISQMYDLMKKFQLKGPIQPPTSSQDSLQQMLGQSLGQVDPGLMV